VINTGTTIITFLMVFLIQSTQNRDTDALQVRIDELIRVTEGARLALLNLEEMKAADLDKVLAKDYENLTCHALAFLQLASIRFYDTKTMRCMVNVMDGH